MNRRIAQLVLGFVLAACVALGGAAMGYAAAALTPLATDCSKSDLPPHTGFQVAPACVKTSFGEVAAQNKDPQLLIVGAPKKVRNGENITLQVSTRNLVRDRFLAAGAGGYYLETGLLDDAGLTRGHFHTACRRIGDLNAAPQPDRNDSFKATEDGRGGAGADTVSVTVPAPKGVGDIQCAVWAGDGSHRMPMMQFANQIPAFDTVRIGVRGQGERGDR